MKEGRLSSAVGVSVRVLSGFEKLVENGLPPLPHVTPHTMRRKYVSVMLLATNFDVPFVQRQVGHTDSKLTMDVYAQLLDRSKRAHGIAFDALLADAQETLYGARSGEFGPLFGPPGDFGLRAENSPSSEIGSNTGGKQRWARRVSNLRPLACEAGPE